MPKAPPSGAVAQAFEAMPPGAQAQASKLRRLILETAAATPGVGRLEETLKWGQPAYLTNETRAGTTLRIGLTRSGQIGLFVHCQSRVIPDFRAVAEGKHQFDGNRGVLLPKDQIEPHPELRLMITAALTYHFFERPLIRYFRKWRSKPGSSSAGTANAPAE